MMLRPLLGRTLEVQPDEPSSLDPLFAAGRNLLIAEVIAHNPPSAPHNAVAGQYNVVEEDFEEVRIARHLAKRLKGHPRSGHRRPAE